MLQDESTMTLVHKSSQALPRFLETRENFEHINIGFIRAISKAGRSMIQALDHISRFPRPSRVLAGDSTWTELLLVSSKEAFQTPMGLKTPIPRDPKLGMIPKPEAQMFEKTSIRGPVSTFFKYRVEH